jgi:hypothetical protein
MKIFNNINICWTKLKIHVRIHVTILTGIHARILEEMHVRILASINMRILAAGYPREDPRLLHPCIAPLKEVPIVERTNSLCWFYFIS